MYAREDELDRQLRQRFPPTDSLLFSVGVNRLWRCLRIKYVAPVNDPFSQTPSRPASPSRAWLWKTTGVQTVRRIEIEGWGRGEALIHNWVYRLIRIVFVRESSLPDLRRSLFIVIYSWISPPQKGPENTPQKNCLSFLLAPIALSRSLSDTLLTIHY